MASATAAARGDAMLFALLCTVMIHEGAMTVFISTFSGIEVLGLGSIGLGYAGSLVGAEPTPELVVVRVITLNVRNRLW
jgi:hypothetical protein